MSGLNFAYQKHALFFTIAGSFHKWKKLPGNLAQIDNGLTKEVWGVDHYHLIFHWEANTGQWERVNGSLKHVSAGKISKAWLH